MLFSQKNIKDHRRVTRMKNLLYFSDFGLIETFVNHIDFEFLFGKCHFFQNYRIIIFIRSKILGILIENLVVVRNISMRMNVVVFRNIDKIFYRKNKNEKSSHFQG